MKKLDQTISVEYPPLQLFRDDLERIEEILSDSDQSVNINSGGYQFDSIDELVTHFSSGRVSELAMSASSPYVTIELTKMWAKLYLGSSEDASAVLFYHLDKVFRSTRRRCWPLYSYYLVWSLNLAFIVFGTYLSEINKIAGIAVGASIGSWIAWVIFVRLRRHSMIWPSRRGSASFWNRKKDDIILSLISAFIGAAFGTIGTILIQSYTR